MENGHAARDSLLRFRSGNLDAARVHALVQRQPLQQFALATAEIEDARIGLDELADDGVIAASQQLRNKGLRHARLLSPCGAGNPGCRRLSASWRTAQCIEPETLILPSARFLTTG